MHILSRTECSALRGLAILGIFLHNYCHWLSGIVRENEYTFTADNARGLWAALSAPDGNLPLHVLSFFGHYGVPVFLFLSGYGLVMKYERAERPMPAALPFVRYHWLKLFRMMIVGFAAFVVVDAMTPGRWHYGVPQVLTMLTMTGNLLAQPDRNIWPGPYWFFGLMLQLYVVYRLLLCRRSAWWTAGLMVVCVGLQLLMSPEGDTINYYRYNFPGGMLPFGLGLLAARAEDRGKREEERGKREEERGKMEEWSRWVLLASALALVALLPWLSLSWMGWTLLPAVVCAAAIMVVKSLGSHLAVLSWLGSVSAALFVCHPLLRKVLIPISRSGDVYTGLLLYIVASLAAAWLFRQIIDRVPSPKL